MMKPLITIGKKWLEQPIEERNRLFKETSGHYNQFKTQQYQYYGSNFNK